MLYAIARRECACHNRQIDALNDFILVMFTLTVMRLEKAYILCLNDCRRNDTISHVISISVLKIVQY